MANYIKCNRANGTVMGTRLHDQPYSLCNPSVFWVRVNPASAGQANPWELTDPEDQVQFQVYQPLPTGKTQPVVDESQGQWVHQIPASSALELQQRRANHERDTETYRLIKIWCERQDEGCEEAFINLGIQDPEHPRYLAYREAADEIRQLRK